MRHHRVVIEFDEEWPEAPSKGALQGEFAHILCLGLRNKQYTEPTLRYPRLVVTVEE